MYKCFEIFGYGLSTKSAFVTAGPSCHLRFTSILMPFNSCKLEKGPGNSDFTGHFNGCKIYMQT